MAALRKQRLVGAVRVAALAVLLLSATASAQEQGDGPINCDANNNPAPETEDQREGRLACELHAGCRFLVVAVVRATCKAGDFFRKLGERENPALPITSSDVADAATPEYPESIAADRAIAEARNYANQSTQGRGMPGSMITTPDGRTAYAETRQNPGRYSENTRGTLIYDDGTIARGAFSQKGEQYGPGQVVTPDGRLRAGSFSSGRLSFYSVETFKEPDGRTSILEGTFCPDNNPCNGEMVRRYSDGTSRREVWFGGVAVTLGELAAKGEVPPKIPLADAAPPEPAIWTPAKGEGLKIESNADGREYEVLFCNGQVMDQGLWGEKGKAPRIVRRDCRQPGPDGLHLVTRTSGHQRYELWCKGKVVDVYSIWNPVGTTAPLPRQQRCDRPQIVEEVDEEEALGKNVVENTLGRGTFGATGRILNPLVVQGPPWPCAKEIEVYMQAVSVRTKGRGLLSPEGYWKDRWKGSPVNILVSDWPSTTVHFHTQYMIRFPNATSQPVVFTLNGYQFREGFFRNANSMRELSASFEARGQIDPAGEWGTGLALNACVARYLADNARD